MKAPVYANRAGGPVSRPYMGPVLSLLAAATFPPQNGFLENRCAVPRNDMFGVGFLRSGTNMPFSAVFSGVILSRAREPSPSAKDLPRCVEAEMLEGYPLMMYNAF